VAADCILETLAKLVKSLGFRPPSGVEARVEASETILISESLLMLACVLKDSVTYVLTLSFRSERNTSVRKGTGPLAGPRSAACLENVREWFGSTADPARGLSVEIVIAGDGIPKSFISGLIWDMRVST
jgi:hypothetical protein